MVGEAGHRLLCSLRQGDPGLDAEQPIALGTQRRIGALGMRYATSRRHPVHVARNNGLARAEAIPMQDLALE
jgi:hypothetical protein